MDFGSWWPNHGPGMLCESTTDSEAQKTPHTSSYIRETEALKPSLRGHRESMDKRLESLLEYVEDAGFETFDSLVTAYYSLTFSESSPLYIEQSLSRERRLSRVIWEVFRSSGQWAAREREGFNEEITKISESILLTESCSAHSALVGKLGPLMVDPQDGPASITSQRVLEMKRIVTSEVSVLNVIQIEKNKGLIKITASQVLGIDRGPGLCEPDLAAKGSLEHCLGSHVVVKFGRPYSKGAANSSSNYLLVNLDRRKMG